MRTIITLFSLSLIFSSCTKSSLRYGGSGGESPARSGAVTNSQSSTNSTIRFGRILQGYLGKPYGGRSKYDPGLDCSLFTGEVFKKYAKIQLPRKSEDQFQSGTPVKGNDLQFGDLVFFQTDGSGISHVGVYVGYNEFIHASSSSGVILSGMSEKYWAKRFVGAKRVLP
ncbi:MAG TPA: NlpC/P60 family protein [candidate division Zixibacteria bacterium]|nr:NlpC/P60 family protein [candidate division Zixibacteria bacterium]